jgi:hypothetical protein
VVVVSVFQIESGQEIHVIDIEDQVARCIVQPNGFVLVDPHHIWEFAIEGDASKWTEQIAKFIYLDKSIQVRCTGTMVKQGGYFATWKERYFICSAKYLFYFKSQSDADHFTAFASETLDRLPKKLSESAQGWISLPNTTVTELGDFEKYSNTFAIAPAPGSDARMYRISAQDPDQMHLFVKHCREAAAVRFSISIYNMIDFQYVFYCHRI